MSIYRVSGPLNYREHSPGELFEATLAPDVEARALKHGAIEIIERSTPRIRPGSWVLPDGWTQANDEAPEGASSVKGASQ